MRLVSYRANGRLRPGILVGELVVDAQRAAEDAGWGAEAADLRSARALLAPEPGRGGAMGARASSRSAELGAAGAAQGRADVRLGPPVPDPGKIICLGLNYRDH